MHARTMEIGEDVVGGVADGGEGAGGVEDVGEGEGGGAGGVEGMVYLLGRSTYVDLTQSHKCS